MALGFLEKAEEILRHVLKKEPKSRDTLLQLGELLHGRLQRAEEAGKYFRKAADLYPFDSKSHFDLGVFLLKTGKPDEALVHFSRASYFAPGGVFDQAHFAMALILRDRGELPEARQKLQELLRATGKPAIHRQAKAILDELSKRN